MSLRQAIKGLIVLVAVVFGTSINAFAHAGHEHAPSANAAWIASANADEVAPQANLDEAGKQALTSLAKTNGSQSTGHKLQSASFRTNGATCPPGACCCQGASSCGMGGHCCASMPSTASWMNDLSNHMRYHLARLGWVYPDIVTGLDRPPKA